jgi:hypothetical protein
VTHQLDDGHTSRKGSTAANGHRHGTLLSNPFDLHGPAPWATDDAPTNDARHAAHGSSNRPKPKRHSGEDSEGHGHVSSRRVRGRSQKRHARHRRPHSSSGSDVEDNGEVTRCVEEGRSHCRTFMRMLVTQHTGMPALCEQGVREREQSHNACCFASTHLACTPPLPVLWHPIQQGFGRGVSVPCESVPHLQWMS